MEVEEHFMQVNIGSKHMLYREGHCVGEGCGVDLRGKEVHEYASFPANIIDPTSTQVEGKTHYFLFCASCWAEKMAGNTARILLSDEEANRSSILRHNHFESSVAYFGIEEAKEEFEEDQLRFHPSLWKKVL